MVGGLGCRYAQYSSELVFKTLLESLCSSALITVKKRSHSEGEPTRLTSSAVGVLSLDQALSEEPLLAYALNGEPLTAHQGRPLRLLVHGWYGVPNVNFLSEIHVQKDQYLGKFQANWYRTLKGEIINGEMK